MTLPATPTPQFDTFYKYDALTRLLFDYADAHPNLVSVESIGKSHEGRDIWVATLTNTATGAAMSCTVLPASITVAGQQQTVSCVIDALPGPLGAGAFPGSAAAGNTMTLRLVARPKEGFFTGPYDSDRSNSASVSPGLDGNGDALAIDTTPANDSASAVVRVRRTSLAGRVFLDRNGNVAERHTGLAERILRVTNDE